MASVHRLYSVSSVTCNPMAAAIVIYGIIYIFNNFLVYILGGLQLILNVIHTQDWVVESTLALVGKVTLYKLYYLLFRTFFRLDPGRVQYKTPPCATTPHPPMDPTPMRVRIACACPALSHTACAN
jgi:hypothetical protein